MMQIITEDKNNIYELKIVNFVNYKYILSKKEELEHHTKEEETKMKKTIRMYETIILGSIMLLPVILLMSWIVDGYGTHIFMMISLLIGIIIDLICYIQIEKIRFQIQRRRAMR